MRDFAAEYTAGFKSYEAGFSIEDCALSDALAIKHWRDGWLDAELTAQGFFDTYTGADEQPPEN